VVQAPGGVARVVAPGVWGLLGFSNLVPLLHLEPNEVAWAAPGGVGFFK